MKKIIPICIALALSLGSVFAIDGVTKLIIDNNHDKIVYYNDAKRNSCEYAIDGLLTENSMMVMGSSELIISNEVSFPNIVFNNGYSDFNLVLIGEGSTQSLQHAIDMAAYSDINKNGKVVFILAPQWFEEEDIPKAAFSSRFDENRFVLFLKNRNISDDTRNAIIARSNELLEADEVQLERAMKYESVYNRVSRNPAKYIEMSTYAAFRKAKSDFMLAKRIGELDEPEFDRNNYVIADEIDYEALWNKGEEVGRIATSNNEYSVANEVYEQFFIPMWDDLKDSAANLSYSNSKEYDDFKLFLNVCRDTGTEVMVINAPVNGFMVDYVGTPKDELLRYYDTIRGICAEYDVKLVSLEEYSYEPYFMRDQAHMGWKGWTRVDEEIYKFYKDK